MDVNPNARDVVVKTTLPSLPASSERAVVRTERLTLRPLHQDDLPSLRKLRLQPEVMAWTSAGRVDGDISETQARLDLYLPPNDIRTFNCAICWKETGELIGMGGCHVFENQFGWPELGYMFRKEFWGKGLATEFVRGFLDAYADLPRSVVELRVNKKSVVAQEDGSAAEILISIIEASNDRSHGVMRKCGFGAFTDFSAPDSRDPSKSVVLSAYRFHPTRNA